MSISMFSALSLTAFVWTDAATRHSYGTRRKTLTAAPSRAWRGSRASVAQDPIAASVKTTEVILPPPTVTPRAWT